MAAPRHLQPLGAVRDCAGLGVAVINGMADFLRGILLYDCARRDLETPKNLANEGKAPLGVGNLYVDVRAAHASAAAGDLAEASLLQSLVEWVLDLVAASERKIRRL